MNYEVIVVGAGHAGCEAALASARLGAKTLLLTISPDTIARMSCNPAIGGLAKGQLVREIDALGGEMALATDATGIQFRLLNTGKGPAVQSPRAQCDKQEYHCYMQRTLLHPALRDNLTIKEEMVVQILTEQSDIIPRVPQGPFRVSGVRTQVGKTYSGRAIIITTGTFMKGVIHIGPEQTIGGRIEEPSAEYISDSLRSLGLEIGRLKTGTPPRLDARSIDFRRLIPQPGDKTPQPFSYRTEKITQPQIPCYLTYTNEETHKIIRSNLDRAPLYTGQIKAVGPRYCPSIEDKVVRFAERTQHQIFLEPEGRNSDWIYCNGISTSLPRDIQEAMVHSIKGLEEAKFLRYGYAIEYDFVLPYQIKPTLETRKIENLYLAGQINGTSGYEEAAAQGIMAGINAVLKLRDEPPFILRRDEAYIGVLIDDLVTLGPTEPYRMFTSRAEYRLMLRSDNADRRLMKYGAQFGLIDKQTKAVLDKKEAEIAAALTFIRKHRHNNKTLSQLLKNPQMTYKKLEELVQLKPSPSDGGGKGGGGQIRAYPPLSPPIKGGENGRISTVPEELRLSLAKLGISDAAKQQVEIEVKYEGYLVRQLVQIDRARKMEDLKLPADINYQAIKHLSKEARTKLTRFQPMTLGQAGRIAGVSPADISVLMIHLKARIPK